MGIGGYLENHTPSHIAPVFKKSPEGYFGNGLRLYSIGAVFERAYRVYSDSKVDLLSYFFSPFGD